MIISVLRLELGVGDCQSLRQKRRWLNAMIGKLRQHFNVSVAEVECEDLPTETVLGVVAVGRHRYQTRRVLERVAAVVSVHPHAELLGHRIVDV
jgi:uncharacterized protein